MTPQQSKITKFENIDGAGANNNIMQSKEFMDTQIKLLESERLAGRVIARLDLLRNKYFNEEVRRAEKPEGWMSAASNALKNLIRPETSSDAGNGLRTKEARDRMLYDHVIKDFTNNLEVKPLKNTDLIKVTFDSPDATLATRIVDTAMQEFVAMNMDSKLDASKLAKLYLDKQIDAARINLEKSEMALNDFAKQSGIVSLDSKLNLTLRELEELNNALAKVRADRLAKEALYKQAISDKGANLSAVLGSKLIQDLKNQYAAFDAEYQDLKTVYKDNYPKVRQIKARMRDVERAISDEQNRIVNSIKNDYEAVRKTEESLTANADEQKKLALDLNDKATQYKILEREVETNKKIHESLLQRSKEIAALVGTDVSNIQIIDEPRVPILPYKPNVLLNLLTGLIAGLFGGVMVAFSLEYLDNTIKDPDELTDRYQIPVLGIIPIDKDKNETDKDMTHKSYNNPRSSFSEAIRTTMVSIELSAAEHPPRTLLITSSMPGEGKSTFSANLAHTFASSGERVLLIDCDLRKPSLHRSFKDGDNSAGLSNYLTGAADLSEVIYDTDFNGLGFISSGPLSPNPAELIASRRMRDLLNFASGQYDHIVLDAPPYQGFAEILVMANMVEGVILVSVIGNTPREGVRYFRKAITNIGGRILGAIVNKAGKGKGYGYYSGYKYYTYSYSYGEREKLT